MRSLALFPDSPELYDFDDAGEGADSFCTPTSVITPCLDLLEVATGEIIFGLDPCTNSRSLVPCCDRYTERDDGLAPTSSWRWHSSIWLNPPYSKCAPWLQRLDAEMSERSTPGPNFALVLIKADTSTAWWERHVWCSKTALAVNFWRRRIAFAHPSNPKGEVAKFPSAIIMHAAAAHGPVGPYHREALLSAFRSILSPHGMCLELGGGR